MLPTSTDVLIVGAGPTGLALAISLQQAGVAYALIDTLEVGQNTSRAAVIHAHTLDVVEEIGVASTLAAEGLKLTRFTIRDRGRRLLEVPFGRLPSTHPYLLMIPQDVTERILSDRLASLGGRIHRGVTATRLVQTATGVEATLTSSAGEQMLTARFCVGADGMHSLVRATTGIPFTGGTYEASFVLADVQMDWSHGSDDVQLFFSPAGLVVAAPLPNGAFRIVATLDDAPERPDIADIQALMDTRGPTDGPARVTEVLWSSRFRLHHRLANAYRDRRLFLMGDAAHVHSPAGGQGMNCGLVDACVLGRLLAGVVTGRLPDSALDQYQQLRRPAARQVLQLAGRLTSLATLRNALARRARNGAFRLIDHVPAARRVLAMNLSGLSRQRFADTGAATSPAPASALPAPR